MALGDPLGFSSQSGAKVASLANGNFVGLWSSSTYPGEGGHEVTSLFMRVFNADGTAQGAVITVAASADLGEYGLGRYGGANFDVIVLQDGNLAVVWEVNDTFLGHRAGRA